MTYRGETRIFNRKVWTVYNIENPKGGERIYTLFLRDEDEWESELRVVCSEGLFKIKKLLNKQLAEVRHGDGGPETYFTYTYCGRDLLKDPAPNPDPDAPMYLVPGWENILDGDLCPEVSIKKIEPRFRRLLDL